MKSPYFCAQHAKRILQNESEAFGSWNEMMNIGVQAYSQCRLDAAAIYLGAALDIAFLRTACASNHSFTTLHIVKPAEFLLDLMLSEQRWNQASRLLARVREYTKSSPQDLCHHFVQHTGKDTYLDEFLQVNTPRVNLAVKSARRLSQHESHDYKLVH